MSQNRQRHPKYPHPQDDVRARSLANPEEFWMEQAAQLKWHVKPTRAIARGRSYTPDSSCLDASTDSPTASNGNKAKYWPWSWSWFPDGELNTCENAVDRHVEAGHGDKVAIIWDSPVDDGAKERYTYSQLKAEVETLAGVMREEGVRKGDVVLIYSMYPAVLPTLTLVVLSFGPIARYFM